MITDKVMFGSDYPFLTPDRWLEDFSNIAMAEAVRMRILKDNAVRVLALADEE